MASVNLNPAQQTLVLKHYSNMSLTLEEIDLRIKCLVNERINLFKNHAFSDRIEEILKINNSLMKELNMMRTRSLEPEIKPDLTFTYGDLKHVKNKKRIYLNYAFLQYVEDTDDETLDWLERFNESSENNAPCIRQIDGISSQLREYNTNRYSINLWKKHNNVHNIITDLLKEKKSNRLIIYRYIITPHEKPFMAFSIINKNDKWILFDPHVNKDELRPFTLTSKHLYDILNFLSERELNYDKTNMYSAKVFVEYYIKVIK